MATLKFRTISKRKNARGLYTVYLAVIAKQDVRYINTGIQIPEENNLIGNRIINLEDAENMNLRLDYIMRICSDKLSLINHREFSCNQIKEYLQLHLEEHSADRNINSLKELAENYIEMLQRKKRQSSAKIFQSSCCKVIEILGDVNIHTLRRKHVKILKDKLYQKGLSDGAVCMVLKNLKRLLRWATEKGIVIYEEDPFDGITIPKSVTRFYDLTEDEFIRMRDYSITDYDLRFVRDMFLLSFYLGGMNMLDLKGLTFNKDCISYKSRRNQAIKKHNQTITLSIPEPAKEILRRYVSGKQIKWSQKALKADVATFFRTRLKRLQKELDISTPLTVNSPGKTFAQYATMLGIDKNVIKYCIGQNVDLQMPIYNYIKVVGNQADAAVGKVVDYVLALEPYDTHKMAV